MVMFIILEMLYECVCLCVHFAEEEKEFEHERITDWHPVKVVNAKQQEYVLQWIKKGYIHTYVAGEDGTVVKFSISVFSCACLIMSDIKFSVCG